MTVRKDITVENVIELVEAGFSYRQIANKLGCCDYTVRKRAKSAGIKSNFNVGLPKQYRKRFLYGKDVL